MAPKPAAWVSTGEIASLLGVVLGPPLVWPEAVYLLPDLLKLLCSTSFHLILLHMMIMIIFALKLIEVACGQLASLKLVLFVSGQPTPRGSPD